MEVFHCDNHLRGIESSLIFTQLFLLLKEIEEFSSWTIFEYEK